MNLKGGGVYLLKSQEVIKLTSLYMKEIKFYLQMWLKNMNRSMSKVLIGGFGDGAGKSTKAKTYEGIAKEVTAEDVTEMLTGAKT